MHSVYTLLLFSYRSFSKTFPFNPLSLFFQGCILLNRGEIRLDFSGPFPVGVRDAPASRRIFLCCILALSTMLPWINEHHTQELCLAVVWDPFHRSLANTGFYQTLKMFDIRIFEKSLCLSWQSLIFDFHHSPLLFPGSPVPVSAPLCNVAPATWLWCEHLRFAGAESWVLLPLHTAPCRQPLHQLPRKSKPPWGRQVPKSLNKAPSPVHAASLKILCPSGTPHLRVASSFSSFPCPLACAKQRSLPCYVLSLPPVGFWPGPDSTTRLWCGFGTDLSLALSGAALTMRPVCEDGHAPELCPPTRPPRHRRPLRFLRHV